jgi:hypothetical protein
MTARFKKILLSTRRQRHAETVARLVRGRLAVEQIIDAGPPGEALDEQVFIAYVNAGDEAFIAQDKKRDPVIPALSGISRPLWYTIQDSNLGPAD